MPNVILSIPVSRLRFRIDGYTRFLDCGPDMQIGDEILWGIEPSPKRIVSGRVIFVTNGFDTSCVRLAPLRITNITIESGAHSVQRVHVPDPGSNALVLCRAVVSR